MAKIAIVTGASRGLGRNTALHIARGGAHRREAGNRRRRGAVAVGVGVHVPAHGIE
jgi:NAD(P)-dependent dehydrogenase (short-subunit alcohol dehydrogenase family)